MRLAVILVWTEEVLLWFTTKDTHRNQK